MRQVYVHGINAFMPFLNSRFLLCHYCPYFPQARMLSQRADVYGFDGRVLEAVSDAQAALAAGLAHVALREAAALATGHTFEPTPSPSDVIETGIPVCIIGSAVITHVWFQKCRLLVQNYDFEGLQCALQAAPVACEAAQLQAGYAQLIEIIKPELFNVVDAADELAEAGDALEGIRSYTISLQGIAVQQVCLSTKQGFFECIRMDLAQAL